jgi:ATP-dependent Lhr-like helicase
MCHEILNANPYAFLDDAPLEERRARAVSLRRVDADLATGIGALDQAAIDEVRRQAWPDVRDVEEFHDVLLTLGVLPVEEEGEWQPYARELIADGRANIAYWTSHGTGDRHAGFVAAERQQLVRLAFPRLTYDPPLVLPPHLTDREGDISEEEALRQILHGWMECIGPTSVPEMAARLGLAPHRIQAALFALEANGIVLQGHFTPGRSAATEEWCERGLLARIHRLTIGRLRREIEPVSAADFIRFLLRWQHVHPGTQLHGRAGLLQVIGQLQGLELPAPAWEDEVLPRRIARYDPSILEDLCLAGVVGWGRLALKASTPTQESSAGPDHGQKPRRAPTPTRAAPLALLLREDLPWVLQPAMDSLDAVLKGLSPAAQQVADVLQLHGASFLHDIARHTGRLAVQVEEALWELVACGLVTGDGIAGLRTLLLPEIKRRPSRHRIAGRLLGRRAARVMPIGRWSLLRGVWTATPAEETPDQRTEALGRQLLRRYGVVFRELLARDSHIPPWRSLLSLYRRLEARGDIRGGRFVAGFIGEQFALPEAVETLRTVRRQQHEPEIAMVSAADPLNLVGILTPGPRISPFAHQVIVYRSGVPAEIGLLGAVTSHLHAQANETQR